MNLPPHKVNMAYLKREIEHAIETVKFETQADKCIVCGKPTAKHLLTRDGICPDHTIYQAGHPFYRGTNYTAAHYGG